MPNVNSISNLGAVVLCGGGSLRMGTAKSQLVFQGRTFLDQIIARVATVADPVVVAVGSDEIPKSTRSEAHLVMDEMPHQGPLEGIRVGLKTLADKVEFAFVTGCDVPLLEPAIIGQLFDIIGEHEAVVPVQGKRVFGLTAIYRTAIANQLGTLICQKRLRVIDLVEHLDTKRLDVETLRRTDSGLDSLTNINSWEQYLELLQRFNEPIPNAVHSKIGPRRRPKR